MYSIHNEGQSVAVEIFINTLRKKIHQHMILVSGNVYTDKLDEIIDKYSNTYHRKIKMNC